MCDVERREGQVGSYRGCLGRSGPTPAVGRDCGPTHDARRLVAGGVSIETAINPATLVKQELEPARVGRALAVHRQRCCGLSACAEPGLSTGEGESKFAGDALAELSSQCSPRLLNEACHSSPPAGIERRSCHPIHVTCLTLTFIWLRSCGSCEEKPIKKASRLFRRTTGNRSDGGAPTGPGERALSSWG